MKIMHYTEAKVHVFDQDPARGVTGRVAIGQADGADHFCMRLFELATDGHTPRHSHAWEHEIFVHAGTGAVYLNGSWQPLEAGSVAFIPGNEEHQLKNTGQDKMIFVCVIPSGAPEI